MVMPKSRSNGACWTCKIRKVKCDETNTACERCTSLRVTCHGYGEKPGWMDGEQRERKEIDMIKSRVKDTNRLKRLGNTQDKASQWNQNAQFSPGISEITSPRQKSSHSQIPSKTNDPLTSAESVGSTEDLDNEEDDKIEVEPPIFSPPSADDHHSVNNTSRFGGTRKGFHASVSGPTNDSYLQSKTPILKGLDERESSLLMHYLDNVFPLQFPLYDSPPWEGGRGWLLGLVQEAPAFLFAVLNLSAYHLQASTPPNRLDHYSFNNPTDLERHYTLAISGLRQRIEAIKLAPGNSDMKIQIGTLGCMIQLISFEIFRGDNVNWQTHLHGARALVQNMRTFYVVSSSFSKEQSSPASRNRRIDELLEQNILSRNDLTALDFFITAFVWFDTLSCATTASQPSCPTWLSRQLQDENGRIQTQNLMGCRNWAIKVVMEIAALEAWKVKCNQNGSLSIRDLARRATCIEKRLQDNLKMNRRPLSSYETVQHGELGLKIRAVTNVFGSSALVYLHVVLSGAWPELREIKESVEKTIEAFHSLQEGQWVSTLVWPFCVAGCMTMPHGEGEFRDIAQHIKVLDQGFRNFGMVAGIVEETWAARRENRGGAFSPCDWKIGMKRLGLSVLCV